MPVHLLKLGFACASVADLAARQAERGQPLLLPTRHYPKRAVEILDGGSLYWIIKGQIAVRQAVRGLESVRDSAGQRQCLIELDPILVKTVLSPHRSIQGWRYLAAELAPQDAETGYADAGDTMPSEMVQSLKALGLL